MWKLLRISFRNELSVMPCHSKRCQSSFADQNSLTSSTTHSNTCCNLHSLYPASCALLHSTPCTSDPLYLASSEPCTCAISLLHHSSLKPASPAFHAGILHCMHHAPCTLYPAPPVTLHPLYCMNSFAYWKIVVPIYSKFSIPPNHCIVN